MRRRTFCRLVIGGSVVSAVPARATVPDFRVWAETYLRQGRVIDWQQNGISHSEGQGWGLLLAQAAGDQVAFEQIEAWTAANLSLRQDRLMAWSRRSEDGLIDWNNATDGDLFRAWALLRAGRDSGWSGYIDTALAIARDIAVLCLAPDPRAPAEPLLLPGAEARREAARVLVNPSYIMPRALRELGEAAGEPRLIRAADHGETLLTELAAADRLWNWVDVTEWGFVEPIEHRAGWGYDAIRIPLYLGWSDRRANPAHSMGLQLLEDALTPGHVVVQRDPRGHPVSESNHPGFLSLVSSARCQPLPGGRSSRSSYYPDTLKLLAETALREGGCGHG
ncbi:glycosyl hydrolase family 8 [Paracoccus hibiscisoli]|uniref:cellulase n=1 Tax=Paracoccus hibiscisoli TaxID=2023261 RepID=A0A4U0QEE5_9RHOB|nr:glycosyl hydrolase family 8 [Paracoccus hibiscisoli]TJZ79865.1 glycosyl hydrolase family 5 [Paracoccus hibiscisoli]